MSPSPLSGPSCKDQPEPTSALSLPPAQPYQYSPEPCRSWLTSCHSHPARTSIPPYQRSPWQSSAVHIDHLQGCSRSAEVAQTPSPVDCSGCWATDTRCCLPTSCHLPPVHPVAAECCSRV